MRFLHTSDWHLGRSFHRVGLLEHQAAVVDHLVQVVAEERVDAVVVAGDLYDRALPPVDAVRLCDEALTRLAATGAQVIVLSGNHDSATRLRFGSSLLERAGVHVRTDPARLAEPVLLGDEHGTVAVYPVPYLEPAAVDDGLAADGRSHRAVLGAAMDRVRADLAGRPADTRSVVAAHAFVTGGEASESERDISVGGVGDVPVSVFDGVDYVALGHLHGPQRVSERVRYSGSPLAYSFSEAQHRKASWLVELDAEGTVRAEAVPVPVPRPLSTLSGELDALLADPAHAALADHFLAVTLTDVVRPLEPMTRLRSRFPHVVTMDWAPTARSADEGGYAARVAGRDDASIARSFVEHVRRSPATDGEERLLGQALEDLRRRSTRETTSAGTAAA